jgi:hypothetical protein
MRAGFAARKSKFGAVRTEVDGITFASKKEARRYGELKLMERAGMISELALQPRFPLYIGDDLICTYVGDFLYRAKSGDVIVEDAKGIETPEFKLKRKLLRAIHGMEIVTV